MLQGALVAALEAEREREREKEREKERERERERERDRSGTAPGTDVQVCEKTPVSCPFGARNSIPKPPNKTPAKTQT